MQFFQFFDQFWGPKPQFFQFLGPELQFLPKFAVFLTLFWVPNPNFQSIYRTLPFFFNFLPFFQFRPPFFNSGPLFYSNLPKFAVFLTPDFDKKPISQSIFNQFYRTLPFFWTPFPIKNMPKKCNFSIDFQSFNTLNFSGNWFPKPQKIFVHRH